MSSVCMVDPSAFTPPYDHALCSALAAQGAEVTLATGRFAYGAIQPPRGYRRAELFYRRAHGAPGSRRRRLAKLAEHVPDMVALRRLAREHDLTHFQWLDVPWLDRRLLPAGPLVLTAHDLLPREPRPGQSAAQRALLRRMDAVITHSAYGRERLIERLSIAPERIHVIPHGAFAHLTELPDERPLVPGLADVQGPVALFFGLLRPYKGLETLLAAWRGIEGAELWIAGYPRMALEPLRARAPERVRFIPRFLDDAELPALFRRASLVVLPYTRTERFDQSGVLATALAFGTPALVSDVGGLPELSAAGAAQVIPAGDRVALHEALRHLLADEPARERLAAGARRAAAGPYSWSEAARRTLAVYNGLLRGASESPP